MSELEPRKFDYASPGTARPIAPPPHPGRVAMRFVWGFFLGIGISAFAWLFVIYKLPKSVDAIDLIIIVLALKFGSSIACFCMRNWRFFGGGMLASIAVGTLIFAGMVVVNVINTCGHGW